ALTGIGGIGKSTLAALIYRYAEEQGTSGSGPFTAEPLWLTVSPSVTMADLAGTLVEALGKPMLDMGSLSPQNQATALFNALNTVDRPRLVVLDQFENLLDWQTGQALPDRVGVGEWLDAINSQPCRCRVLLTSRPDPRGTRDYPATCLQPYHVEGLEEAEGIELLRKEGVTGPETELGTAVARCDGHAFALTLLASLIRTRKLSLAMLLKGPTYDQLWTGKVAQNLLDAIYKQLDEVQRKLLVAFSLYREPVPLEASQAIIHNKTEISKAQVESALDALLTQHLLQASGEGRYQLHVIVADYARGHVVESSEQANQQALKAAHTRAAQYYLKRATTTCLPREQRRQISDVHDLIEAIWQYCQAEQWQEAYDLIEREGIFNDLNRWGAYPILLELYKPLLPSDKWHPGRLQVADIYNHIGWLYFDMGQFKWAQGYYQEALSIYKELEDREQEGTMLINLGVVYNRVGNTKEAVKCYEQALDIHKEMGNRKEEGRTLNNLGLTYSELGRKAEALDCYEEALRIHREVGDRKEEGRALSNLGLLYNALREPGKAIESLSEALRISRNIGNRKEEGRALNNLGMIYSALGRDEEAFGCFKEAFIIHRTASALGWEGGMLNNLGALYYRRQLYKIALAFFLLARDTFEAIQSPDLDTVQRWIDGLHQKVGEEQFTALLSRVEPQAHQIIEQALREGLGHDE
ncbi:MAG TPA: tetratricopeptide repeat protein, partial [Ktedonobacteraceae bacterium]|nr:tetratricopeptide repeat protein [Ktedonobacteraceae bacterium]